MGKFDAAEWLNSVRDRFYEETKDMSREEVRAYIRHRADALHQSLKQPVDRDAPGKSVAA